MRYFRTLKVEGEFFEPGYNDTVGGVVLAVFLDMRGDKWFAFEDAYDGVHVIHSGSRFLKEVSP